MNEAYDLNPVINYIRENSCLFPEDIFKYLFQSFLGCEHLVSDAAGALERIRKESEYASEDDLPETEILDGDYCRLHLKLLNKGLSPETLCRLFVLSSQTHPEGKARIEQHLSGLTEAAREGIIPFGEYELRSAADRWIHAGMPPIHHSDGFRKAHHPAYRVIRKDYLRLIPLLIRIDTVLKQEAGGERCGTVLAAVDGRCASGKTTLARELSAIYDCNVFHMDDYFLRPESRCRERLEKPGENIDHERFLKEVLLPISENREVTFRRYDCHEAKLLEPVTVPGKTLTIVEGVYSLHPSLYRYYDIKVFSDISEEEQRKRIKARNDAFTARRFFDTWIPLEEKYFDALGIRDKAQLII